MWLFSYTSTIIPIVPDIGWYSKGGLPRARPWFWADICSLAGGAVQGRGPDHYWAPRAKGPPGVVKLTREGRLEGLPWPRCIHKQLEECFGRRLRFVCARSKWTLEMSLFPGRCSRVYLWCQSGGEDKTYNLYIEKCVLPGLKLGFLVILVHLNTSVFSFFSICPFSIFILWKASFFIIIIIAPWRFIQKMCFSNVHIFLLSHNCVP